MPASEEVWKEYEAKVTAHSDRFVKRDAYMMMLKERIDTLPAGVEREASVVAIKAAIQEWEADKFPPVPAEIKAEAEEMGGKQ